MSENTLNHFLSLLLAGNYDRLITTYYDDGLKTKLNNINKTKNDMFGLGLFQQTLNLLQVLQFKVINVEYKGNNLSYEVYLVTKDDYNEINFSEHQVLNKWKNNLIYYHKHLATNY